MEPPPTPVPVPLVCRRLGRRRSAPTALNRSAGHGNRPDQPQRSVPPLLRRVRRTRRAQWRSPWSDPAQLLEPVGDALGRVAQPITRHLDVTGGHVVTERMVDQGLERERADVGVLRDPRLQAASAHLVALIAVPHPNILGRHPQRRRERPCGSAPCHTGAFDHASAVSLAHRQSRSEVESGVPTFLPLMGAVAAARGPVAAGRALWQRMPLLEGRQPEPRWARSL